MSFAATALVSTPAKIAQPLEKLTCSTEATMAAKLEGKNVGADIAKIFYLNLARAPKFLTYSAEQSSVF
jgi:hypothetical protein